MQTPPKAGMKTLGHRELGCSTSQDSGKLFSQLVEPKTDSQRAGWQLLGGVRRLGVHEWSRKEKGLLDRDSSVVIAAGRGV